MISIRCSRYIVSVFKNKILNDNVFFKTFSSPVKSLIASSLDIVDNKNNLSEQFGNKLSKLDHELTASELNVLADEKNNWTEEFGTLSQKKIQIFNDEEEDDKPYVRLSQVNRRHGPDWYAKKIAKLGKMNMIYEAIDVLETEMLITDRVMPNEFVFTNLISVLGKVGYTKKAFQLFNKMKKFGIVPSGHTYTSLFNCCSNSPDKIEGLQMVTNLKNLMNEKEIEINPITFRAMLKAIARLGDIQMAFNCVDEAIKLRIKLDENLYSFLLMACISDKQNGFNLALRVWLMILTSKSNLNIFHINLILKAARDCEMGNIDQVNNLFKSITNETVHKIQTKLQIKNILPNNKYLNDSLKIIGNMENFSCENFNENKTNDKTTMTQLYNKNQLINFNNININNNKKYTSLDFSNLPPMPVKSKSVVNKHQIIEKEYNISEMINKSLKDNKEKKVTSASLMNILLPINMPNITTVNLPLRLTDKLCLMGGLEGFTDLIKTLKIEPDLKTVSLLLDLISTDSTVGLAEEKFLLDYISDKKIQLDITFYNLLIKKRILQKNFEGAKKILVIMSTDNIEPNIKTFGCLAMGCIKKQDAFTLISDMKKLDMVPNVEICSILMARTHEDFDYKLDILKLMQQQFIRPNASFLQKLDQQVTEARTIITRIEQGKEVKPKYLSGKFQEGYRRFVLNYKTWLQQMDLEPNVHPWDPFKQPTIKKDINN